MYLRKLREKSCNMLVLLTIFSQVLQITNGIDNPDSCVENGVDRFNRKTGSRKCPKSPMEGLQPPMPPPMDGEFPHLPLTCKNSKVDVGFILDSSSSMQNNYQDEKKLLKHIATAFHVTNSRIGVISFGTRTIHNIRLNEHVNSSSFNAAVDAISFDGSTARRDKALRYAQEEFFTSQHGARSGASRLLVFLTGDSRTQGVDLDEITSIANELVRREIVVVVVTIASANNTAELIRIAGSVDNVFRGESFQHLFHSNVTDTILGKYCKKTYVPVWPWDRGQVLIDSTTPITRNHTIATLEEVDVEYKVILQFWPSSVQKGWGNVIHLTTGGNDENKYGDRIPAVYYHGADEKIEISSAVSGNAFFYKHVSPVSPNMWHTVEITQEKEELDYYYSVVVNGNQVVRVVNNQPQVFTNVSIYASDPWYSVQHGFIRFLRFYRKELTVSASMRMPARIKDKDKEAYTRTAGVVISVGFLAMIGAGFL